MMPAPRRHRPSRLNQESQRPPKKQDAETGVELATRAYSQTSAHSTRHELRHSARPQPYQSRRISNLAVEAICFGEWRDSGVCGAPRDPLAVPLALLSGRRRVGRQRSAPSRRNFCERRGRGPSCSPICGAAEPPPGCHGAHGLSAASAPARPRARRAGRTRLRWAGDRMM